MTYTKRDFFEHILCNGSVWLHLDARHSEVVVPEHLAKREHLVLLWAFGSVLDFLVTDYGVSGDLDFKGFWLPVVVPWTAVFAMRGEDGRGMDWAEDAPFLKPEPKVKVERHLRLVHSR
jgi:stringent starvation protein B